MAGGKRRESVFSLAGLKTLLDTSGSRRHSVAVKSVDQQNSLTTEQTEAALQLREFLQERQRLQQQSSAGRCGAAAAASFESRSAVAQQTTLYASTNDEDEPAAAPLPEEKSLSDDQPLDTFSAAAMLPRSFVPHPTSRRASVAVMHMTPDQKFYDLPTTPSTVCPAEESALHARNASWTPAAMSRHGSSLSQQSATLRSESQTQTRDEPGENRGCQTVESALQCCERGVQVCLDNEEEEEEAATVGGSAGYLGPSESPKVFLMPEGKRH